MSVGGSFPSVAADDDKYNNMMMSLARVFFPLPEVTGCSVRRFCTSGLFYGDDAMTCDAIDDDDTQHDDVSSSFSYLGSS